MSRFEAIWWRNGGVGSFRHFWGLNFGGRYTKRIG